MKQYKVLLSTTAGKKMSQKSAIKCVFVSSLIMHLSATLLLSFFGINLNFLLFTSSYRSRFLKVFRHLKMQTGTQVGFQQQLNIDLYH